MKKWSGVCAIPNPWQIWDGRPIGKRKSLPGSSTEGAMEKFFSPSSVLPPMLGRKIEGVSTGFHYVSEKPGYAQAYLQPEILRRLGAKKSRVLDIGCGNGAMAAGLAVVVSDIPEWKKLYVSGNYHDSGKGYRIWDTGSQSIRSAGSRSAAGWIGC